MNKIKGNLISLALQGEFDVIAHGLNCFNTQKNGIAKDMVKCFKTDTFPMELGRKGDYNKLGCIDWMNYSLFYKDIDKSNETYTIRQDEVMYSTPDLAVVNCYTQYYHLRNAPKEFLYLTNNRVVDYTALLLCLNKINFMFKGKHVGLPYIGCGLAGGDSQVLETYIEMTLTDCTVTLVEYDNT